MSSDDKDPAPLLLNARVAQRLSVIFGRTSAEAARYTAHRAIPSKSHEGGTANRLLSIDGLHGQQEASCSLRPLLLDRPVDVQQSLGFAWLDRRDTSIELAVSVSVLGKLQVPSGSLVLVSNPDLPSKVPHLARILGLTPGQATATHQPAACAGYPSPEDTVLLAPSLAFNLGLQLHLHPLLVAAESASGAAEDAAKRDRSVGQEDRRQRVVVVRYKGADEAEESGTSVCVKGAGRDDIRVPVAQLVTFAKVRTPAVSALPQPQTRQAEGTGDSKPKAENTDEGGGEGGHDGNYFQDVLVAALQAVLTQTTRLLAPGDVIAVPVPSTALHVTLHVPRPPTTPQLVYLKVVAMEPRAAPHALALDCQLTSVSLQGSCCSAWPVGLGSFMTPNQAGSTAPADHPPASQRSSSDDPKRALLGHTANAANAHVTLLPSVGPLLPAWRTLARILAPRFHNSATGLALHVSVLLCGPRGSGKSCAVHAAAVALGVHILSLNCHDLKGSTENKTLGALRAAAQGAAEYSPCVLLLREFNVLCETDGNPAAGGDAAAKRMASALTQCMLQNHATRHMGALSAETAVPSHATAIAATADGSRGLAPETREDSETRLPVVLVAGVEDPNELPAPVRRVFTHEVKVESPDAAGRETLLQHYLSAHLSGSRDPSGITCETGGTLEDDGSSDFVGNLVAQTAGLFPRDLIGIASEAFARCMSDRFVATDASQMSTEVHSGADSTGVTGTTTVVRQSTSTTNWSQRETATPGHVMVSDSHVECALESVRQRAATEIGAPKVPNVKWDDIGGLENVKKAILDTVELPLKYPQLFAAGLRRRSGILLYGPPGTGKTLLAKAVATECGTSFLSVKGPELINMYIGESERQVREVFARARRAAPCVLFFDELDSLAPARGAGADSGGVMDRVVAQLLAEIDGVQDSSDGGGTPELFLMGATNRPDLLDPALMRPGRLDTLLYVGIAADTQARLKVLQALTRKFILDDTVDLQEICEMCCPRLTGADIYALAADAWMNALRRTIETPTPTAPQDGGAEEGVCVSHADFVCAVNNLQPSVSEDEMHRYESLHQLYEAKK